MASSAANDNTSEIVKLNLTEFSRIDSCLQCEPDNPEISSLWLVPPCVNSWRCLTEKCARPIPQNKSAYRFTSVFTLHILPPLTFYGSPFCQLNILIAYWLVINCQNTTRVPSFNQPHVASKTFEADLAPGLGVQTKINPSFQSVSLNTVSISSVWTRKGWGAGWVGRGGWEEPNTGLSSMLLCVPATLSINTSWRSWQSEWGPILLCSKVSRSPDFPFLTCLEMRGRSSTLEKCPSHLQIRTVVKIPATLKPFLASCSERHGPSWSLTNSSNWLSDWYIKQQWKIKGSLTSWTCLKWMSHILKLQFMIQNFKCWTNVHGSYFIYFLQYFAANYRSVKVIDRPYIHRQ